MLSAFKRQKTEKLKAVVFGKDIVRLVVPFVFPGCYDRDYFLAFRTFLALCGTCRKLRYWNSLRRWIGWLSPSAVREMLRAHSFPVPMTAGEYLPVQDHIHRYLEMHGEIPDAARVDFVSRTVSNAQALSNGEQSNFEADFAGIPFFDVIDCYIRSPNAKEERKIVAFRASTFAELCLFCYAVLSLPISTNKEDAVIVVCGWKTVDDGVVYVKERGRLYFVEKSLLGRLQKLGWTSPPEIGFQHGSLPMTSFAFFSGLVEKRSRKNKFPLKRLEQFAHRWFPCELFHDGEKFKAAYNFDIIFEAPETPAPSTQEIVDTVPLDRSVSMEVIKPRKQHKSK